LTGDDCLEKGDMVSRVLASYDPDRIASKYDLIANITHTGKPQEGSYKAHVLCRPKDQWYDYNCNQWMPHLKSFDFLQLST
jgi:ubiquitin C-terminal hydrolase